MSKLAGSFHTLGVSIFTAHLIWFEYKMWGISVRHVLNFLSPHSFFYQLTLIVRRIWIFIHVMNIAIRRQLSPVLHSPFFSIPSPCWSRPIMTLDYLHQLPNHWRSSSISRVLVTHLSLWIYARLSATSSDDFPVFLDSLLTSRIWPNLSLSCPRVCLNLPAFEL